MADTAAFGNILTDAIAAWLSSPVTQQDKVDNPITIPPPSAADAQERATAKVGNTLFNALEDLNRWYNGDKGAGAAGAGEFVRFLAGIKLTDEAELSAGRGSPEGVRTGVPGSLYLNLSGGASTTLYIKETGTGTNTGWVAYGPGGSGGGNPARKDIIPGQVITGTDTALSTTLTTTPDANSLLLTLNGAEATEGQDYSLLGVVITWLAGTGSAVDLDTNDQLVAYYRG